MGEWAVALTKLILEFWPYALGVVGMIASWFGIYKLGKANEANKKYEDILHAARKSKAERERIQTLDDDRLISEFDRLHNSRR